MFHHLSQPLSSFNLLPKLKERCAVGTYRGSTKTVIVKMDGSNPDPSQQKPRSMWLTGHAYNSNPLHAKPGRFGRSLLHTDSNCFCFIALSPDSDYRDIGPARDVLLNLLDSCGGYRSTASLEIVDGSRPGTRIKLTEEKEALIGQLLAEGKAVAAIARIVELTRKAVDWRFEATNSPLEACKKAAPPTTFNLNHASRDRWHRRLE